LGFNFFICSAIYNTNQIVFFRKHWFLALLVDNLFVTEDKLTGWLQKSNILHFDHIGQDAAFKTTG